MSAAKLKKLRGLIERAQHPGTPSPEVAFIVKTENLKCEVYTTKKMTAKAMRKELLAYLADGEAEVVVKSRRRYRRAA